MDDNRTLIGIDLGGTKVRAGRVEQGVLMDTAALPVRADRSVQDVMEQLYYLIDRLAADDVTGIGVGVPSVVDVEQGIVYDVQNIPSWQEVPVKAMLEECYGVPVFVNNDANCFALGEKHFGKGQAHDDMIGLILGTGFAGGIILGSRLYTGANCGAGEFGMMPYLDSIYEHYCSGQFFERAYGLSGAEAYERARQGDEAAGAMFDAFGRHLGHALKAVIYAYDPALIVFGGSVRHAYRFFSEAMWEVLHTFAFQRSIERLTIERSEVEHVAVLGAAALVLNAASRRVR